MAAIFSMVVAVFLLTLCVCWCYRSGAASLGLFASPTSRGHHRVKTVTGGGLAFASAALLGLVFIFQEQYLVFVVSLGLLALLGFIDDISELGARFRLICQFVLMATFLALLQPFRLVIEMGPVALPIQGILWLLPIVLCTWMVNAHNFMDGIDGLAAVQSFFVLTAGSLCLYLAGIPELSLVALILAASCLAFSIFNLPPASMFMGDAGSLYLGFAIAGLMMMSAGFQSDMLWIWSILNVLFMTDATLTLVRRLIIGEDCFKPHRSHLYQLLADQLGVKAVNGLLLLINLILVLPAALLVIYSAIPAFWIFLAIYTLSSTGFVLVYWRCKRLATTRSNMVRSH